MDATPDLPLNVNRIFLSGFGELDADIYRKLKKSGIYMCEILKTACLENRSSDQCRLGQALFH